MGWIIEYLLTSITMFSELVGFISVSFVYSIESILNLPG